MVLHHTFDPDYIAPDSRNCVNQDRVFAVDCVFHEDKGLLRCLRNDDAIRAVKKHIRSEDWMSDAFKLNFTAVVRKIWVFNISF